jgi:large subunit ribosomal protein L21
MFAIIETGGKQYRVAPGNTIKVEKIEGDGNITLSNVLLVQKDDGSLLVGKPLLENVSVDASINKTFKDVKVIDFHKRRRKNSRRKNGHRQLQTELKIIEIKIK